jgi:hypothetical protein
MAHNSPKRMGDVWTSWARSRSCFGIDSHERLKFAKSVQLGPMVPGIGFFLEPSLSAPTPPQGQMLVGIEYLIGDRPDLNGASSKVHRPCIFEQRHPSRGVLTETMRVMMMLRIAHRVPWPNTGNGCPNNAVETTPSKLSPMSPNDCLRCPRSEHPATGRGTTDYSILTAVPAAVTMSMLPWEPIAS